MVERTAKRGFSARGPSARLALAWRFGALHSRNAETQPGVDMFRACQAWNGEWWQMHVLLRRHEAIQLYKGSGELALIGISGLACGMRMAQHFTPL
jgi:hypothetical protein